MLYAVRASKKLIYVFKFLIGDFFSALPVGSYLVRVLVNGNLIPTYQYVSLSNADISVFLLILLNYFVLKIE